MGLICCGGNMVANEDHSSLPPCPNKPNCVSSQAKDKQHAIDSFPLAKSTSSLNLIAEIIQKQPRTRIVEHTDTYLHAEFTSRWFRFIDDVEFLCLPGEEQMHVRSASRVGYSDLGVNRRRIETLRNLYLEMDK